MNHDLDATITIRLSRKELEAFAAAAARADRPVSSWTREAMREKLKREAKRAENAP